MCIKHAWSPVVFVERFSLQTKPFKQSTAIVHNWLNHNRTKYNNSWARTTCYHRIWCRRRRHFRHHRHRRRRRILPLTPTRCVTFDRSTQTIISKVRIIRCVALKQCELTSTLWLFVSGKQKDQSALIRTVCFYSMIAFDMLWMVANERKKCDSTFDYRLTYSCDLYEDWNVYFVF